MIDLTKASGAEPLYAYRPVLNAEEIHAWAREQGFESALEPDDMHVTVVFSRRAFSIDATWAAKEGFDLQSNNVIVKGGARSVVPLGDKGAVVLKITSGELAWEHGMFRDMGASWDFDDYMPHITITYKGDPARAADMQPFEGDIVLGPLRAKMLNTEWDSQITEVLLKAGTHVKDVHMDQIDKATDILKVDAARRIVWGWASVSTVKGELVVDRQGDRIAPDQMEKMADRFMRSVRAAKAMHDGDDVGEVIHSLPLTKELANSLGIETDREGWITGTYIKSDEEWARVERGDYKGLSIGGKAKRKPVE